MKAGKWLLIFGIIALVSAIAFGCTVAAFGVANANYGISLFGHDILGGFNMGNSGIIFNDHHTRITYDFEKNKQYTGDLDGTDISDIKLELASCRTTINCADTEKISISYTTSSRPVEFTAEAIDGELLIKEKVSSFLNFDFKSSELSVTIPKTLYNSIDVDLASGKIAASDLNADSFSANVASGSLELGLSAENINLNLASGKVDMTNSVDSVSDRIKLNVASGSVNMNGYKANDTDVDVASGHVTLCGISGKVKGELASGKLVLTYADWNNDLKVELMSGSVDVTLPAGSGVNADFERLSGGMNINLDGQSEKLSKNATITVGGSNVHNVKAETASGNVSIHN